MNLNKEFVLAEIKRVADEVGKVPGRELFSSYTGIVQSQVIGVYWRTWGDALRAAGFSANSLNEAISDDDIVGRVAALIRELGHFPTNADKRIKRRSDPTFPSPTTIEKRFNRNELMKKILDYCKAYSGNDDVAAIVVSSPRVQKRSGANATSSEPDVQGHVYLMRADRDRYKIGRTNSPQRRHREVALNVPYRTELVHTIATDDPSGIERYWHRRFESRRISGTEFFNLNVADITAFKRRKVM